MQTRGESGIDIDRTIELTMHCRSKFRPKEKTELRFEGNGYVKLEPELYYLSGQQMNNIKFRFRAADLDGLLFLAGSPEHGHLAIRLRAGILVFT